jgi:hypothetical protein
MNTKLVPTLFLIAFFHLGCESNPPVGPPLSSFDVTIPWEQTNGPYGGSVNFLAVSGANLFAGTGGGVFLSTNNGTSWSIASSGMPTDGSVSALAVSPVSGGSGSNLIAATYGRGIFLSTNNGASWTAVTLGLSTNAYVRCLAVGGTSVYAATDNGTSWTTTGPMNNNVTRLAADGNNVFAGTGGSGVWRHAL